MGKRGKKQKILMASSSSSAAAAQPPPPPWVDLPPEITSAILQKVGAVEILTTAQKVCTTWRKICKDPATWRVIDIRFTGGLRHVIEKMFRHAVDLSQGQLIDIKIERFGCEGLLAYLAQRSGQLRRLRLVSAYVAGEGLSQAATKFPFLEELHLYSTYIDSPAIKAIGCSYPSLRTFKLNKPECRHPHLKYDEEALAVAASMPKLRHLQLYGNTMTNKGLTAILDGCPQLESLDLRKCLNLKLGGKLGTRCSQQIKDLRLPDDSTEDYAFNSEVCACEFFDEGYPSGFSDINLTFEDDDSPYVYEFYSCAGYIFRPRNFNFYD